MVAHQGAVRSKELEPAPDPYASLASHCRVASASGRSWLPKRSMSMDKEAIKNRRVPSTVLPGPQRELPVLSPLSAEILLARLPNVRRTGDASWRADCPNGHQHARGSLAIKKTTTGCILMHCFACADTSGILSSIGLTVADLFPRRIPCTSGAVRQDAWAAFKWDCWRAALGVLGREATCVLVAASMLAHGEPLSAEDHARLQLAQERIADTRAVLA